MVVEWTRSSVRLAIAEGGGARWRLRILRSQPIGAGGSPASALQALMRAAKRPAAEVISVVPREQVITRVVEFPTTDPRELGQMAGLYARAQLPYSMEQTVMDVSVLSGQRGFTTVVIVACQREVIERHVAWLREAGASASFLTVSSWGVRGWYHRAMRTASVTEPCLVVNVDENRTDFVLLAEHRLLSSRSIGQGWQDWEATGEVATLLSGEVERSRAAIRKELPGTDVRSLLLTGCGPLAQWKEELARRTGIALTVVTPQLPTEPRAAASAGVPYSPVVVEGLAMSELRTLLNLSPPEVRSQTRHRREIRELIAVSILLVVALGLGSLLIGLQLARQERTARDLDSALHAVIPSARQLEANSRTIQLVSGILEDRRRLATSLSEILSHTPGSVTLEGVTFERQRREVTVKGRAASRQLVLEYLKELERVEGVRGVDLKYLTQRTSPTGESTTFELSLRLTAPNEAERIPGRGAPRARSSRAPEPRAAPPTPETSSPAPADSSAAEPSPQPAEEPHG